MKLNNSHASLCMHLYVGILIRYIILLVCENGKAQGQGE